MLWTWIRQNYNVRAGWERGALSVALHVAYEVVFSYILSVVQSLSATKIVANKI